LRALLPKLAKLNTWVISDLHSLSELSPDVLVIFAHGKEDKIQINRERRISLTPFNTVLDGLVLSTFTCHFGKSAPDLRRRVDAFYGYDDVLFIVFQSKRKIYPSFIRPQIVQDRMLIENEDYEEAHYKSVEVYRREIKRGDLRIAPLLLHNLLHKVFVLGEPRG